MKGFLNLGNTCYFNSTLQCLLNCTPLINYFNRHEYTGSDVAIIAFKDVINEYWNGNTNVVDPGLFLRQLTRWSSQFKGHLQQDSHEAYLCMLEGLHKATRHIKLKKSPYYLNVDRDGCAFKQRHLEKRSLITDIFDGQMKVTVSDVHYETFRSIELTPLPNATVDALVFDYFKAEKADDSNNTIKRTIQFPPVCIALAFKQFFNKVTINIKNTLDLTWFLDKSHHCPFVPKYELYGVILHGGNRHGGHYISATRVGDQWYLNNDSRVTKINFKDIQTDTIYMMFFVAIKPFS